MLLYYYTIDFPDFNKVQNLGPNQYSICLCECVCIVAGITTICVKLLSWQGNKKTLILQEIPEEGVKKLLSNKESLASCDVTVFVYDRWVSCSVS